jgi:hypothetical protein
VIEIQETTIDDVAGVSVGVANIWDREYVDGKGARRAGLTARLDYEVNGETVRTVVGEGSVVEIGGKRWEVTKLVKPPEANGTVTLRAVP